MKLGNSSISLFKFGNCNWQHGIGFDICWWYKYSITVRTKHEIYKYYYYLIDYTSSIQLVYKHLLIAVNLYSFPDIKNKIAKKEVGEQYRHEFFIRWDIDLDIKKHLENKYHEIMMKYWDKQAWKESEERGTYGAIGGTEGWYKWLYHKNLIK